MLPTAPLPFFKEEDIVFKEVSELAAIGDALFADFLYECNSKPGNKFLNNLDLNNLLKLLKNDLTDENVWLIYLRHEIIGFWFVQETDNKITLNFYLTPQFNKTPLEKFFLGFCKAFADMSKSPVYVNVAHFSDAQKETYFGSINIEPIVPCGELLTTVEPDNFEQLIEKITPYYA